MWKTTRARGPAAEPGGYLPHLGQLTIWIILVVALVKALAPFHAAAGEPNEGVTLLSFLPRELRSSELLFNVGRVGLAASAACWACRVLIPFSSWVSVACFTLIVALSHENASNVSHGANLPNQILFLHALWYHFHADAIVESTRSGDFWRTRIYPKSIFFSSIACIGIFHTHAGLSKLINSGVEWANGLSLQLWVHLWRQEDSILAPLLLRHRDLAQGLQVATLIVETASILAIVSGRLRCVLGLGLLGFYCSVIEIFGYLFHLNAILVALFFLPFDRGLAQAQVVLGNLPRVRVHVQSGSGLEKCSRFLVSRFDLLQLVEVRTTPPRKPS